MDKVPVAELLKGLVDLTDYRAILAVEDATGSSGRLWRNLDKLVSDAQTSRQVNVRDFLQYLTTVSDAGAREGEAPVEAQGAVRLMTIHRAKGLEFPVVVLADAGRRPNRGRDDFCLLPEYGLSFKLETVPMLYRLATRQEEQQTEAEEQRLLYVALTRARDKLIISGHAAPSRPGAAITTAGWLAALSEAAGVDVQELIGHDGGPVVGHTAGGHAVRASLMVREPSQAQSPPTETEAIPQASAAPLYHPLETPALTIAVEDEQTTTGSWRVIGDVERVPADVIGRMVHRAIALWLIPDDPRLPPMLESAALDAGLVTREERTEAARRVTELIDRLHKHPLWNEIASASERHHEIPYSRLSGDRAETGYIDLLFQTADCWHVVDFKTDSIRSEAERAELVKAYRVQMRRYSQAVQSLLGQPATTRICFLDDNGKVAIVTP